jgi:hypothetical protein
VKLTIARLLDMAELSDAALRVYLTAHARIEETSAQGLTAAGLMNLPGMPRNPKALARTIQELASHGLVVGAETGRYLFASLAPDVSSKRAAAGRLGGLAKASKRLASATAPPLANGLAVPEVMPAGCQPDATDPPLSLISGSGSSSGISPDSSALSSDSEPVSKPARGRRWRRVPADWAPDAGHFELAKSLGVSLESQLVLFRDHEFKDPKSDADAAFRTWLRRAAQYRPPVTRAGGSLPLLMDRIQRMEASGEGD